MTRTIRPAVAADLQYAVRNLEAMGLPSSDLKVENLAFSAEKDNLIQGVIGIQSFGDCALLRSLVVSSDARGEGLGAALVTALEVASKADGVAEIWLLTIDADAFFVRLGYESRDRNDAPESIRQTEEFSGLCPGDAVLMSKRL